MSQIAVIGAGRVGTAVARTAMRAGHEVSLVGSAPLEDTRFIASVVAPGAVVRHPAEAVSWAEITILAIPLHKYRTVSAPDFAGRIVVDAMNYWPPVNGVLPEFEGVPSSTVIARFLAGAQMVKTLNHIGYHELESDGRPSEHPDRRALALAGDHWDASAVVADFIDSLGYDPVVFEPLDASAVLEPGSDIFSGTLDAAQMREELVRSDIHLATTNDRTPSWS